jgi:hypothetical protein
MRAALKVEWRWVPVSESENAERCQHLRELLLRGARRLSQAAGLARRLEASASEAPSKSNFPAVPPSVSGDQHYTTEKEKVS